MHQRNQILNRQIPNPKWRHGFTLVELLVVITIIGILIALLLPAVQAAREAARRLQNANNLKQIGLAMAGYEQTFGIYPIMRDGGGPYHVSWAFRLLPFMEQQAVFDSHHYDKPSYDAANISSMRTVISTFINPSRRGSIPYCEFDNDGAAVPNPPGKQKVAACGDYAANRGWSASQNTCCDVFDPKKSGPFSLVASTNQKLKLVTVADIRDGLSSTIAVGDKWLSDNVTDLSIFCGDNPWVIQRGSERGFPTGPNDDSQEKFGSPTGGMAAFVFLDGHVSAISYAISLDVLKCLCAVGDGNVISGSDY